ncbi:MAG: hypothetical protein KME60_13235 [Cyanomargarita calcarea GSE-NOS-MK-12-04C]|jgi:hypothetical protein|uniref:Uncharacterized protein n=1 Tax=Cyanomargarita calcarea GSE-NOS-MK-12-04C TaxID=2839659 RepID=A0A951USY0_9CYAN|nr:hypothetical protein [Cyanomargarita calcarea GSE-NOS-MK-12-04C]
MPPYTNNLKHLCEELRCLDLFLEQAIKQFPASRQQNIPGQFLGLLMSPGNPVMLRVTNLSSKLSKNTDKAFVRRLHFSIEFPFPDEQQSC